VAEGLCRYEHCDVDPLEVEPRFARTLGRVGGRCSSEWEADDRASALFVADGHAGVLMFEEAFGDREA
jgi:hypothetical protein